MLNQRLLACAEFVQGNFICDVGTDHAQLPIYLVKNQVAQKAIACDVREGPLQAAEKNITQAGLKEQIQTILSDGLQNVPDKALTDIVIAGMGGETIIHILETCPFSLKTINLILQPMSKAELLRKWLYQHHFEIQQEICIPDKQFLYAIMQVNYTELNAIPEVSEIYFGKMNLNYPDCRAYAQRVIRQLRKANFHPTPELSELISTLEEKLT